MDTPYPCWRLKCHHSGVLTLLLGTQCDEAAYAEPTRAALLSLEDQVVQLEAQITALAQVESEGQTPLRGALALAEQRLGDALGRFWTDRLPLLTDRLVALPSHFQVRVVLELEMPEAQALPWELLRWSAPTPEGPHSLTWIGTDPRFTLLRLAAGGDAPVFATQADPVEGRPEQGRGPHPPPTVTLVSAEPLAEQGPQLPFTRAFLGMTAGAQEGLAPLLRAGRITLATPRLASLDDVLGQSGRHAVFHWFGHGQVWRAQNTQLERTRLYRSVISSLGASSGDAAAVSPEVHVRLFAPEKTPALAVLLTCYGAGDPETPEQSQHDPTLAAAFLKQDVPAVIAARGQLALSGAELFSRSFYARLGNVAPLDHALQAARRAVQGAGLSDTGAGMSDAWWRLNLIVLTLSALDWGAIVAGAPGTDAETIPLQPLAPPLSILLAGVEEAPSSSSCGLASLVAMVRASPLLYSVGAPARIQVCMGVRRSDLIRQLRRRLGASPGVLVLSWTEDLAETPLSEAPWADPGEDTAVAYDGLHPLVRVMALAPLTLVLAETALPEAFLRALHARKVRCICLTGAAWTQRSGPLCRVLEQVAQGAWLHDVWATLQATRPGERAAQALWQAEDSTGLPWGELPLSFGEPWQEPPAEDVPQDPSLARFGSGWCAPVIQGQALRQDTAPALRWLRYGPLGVHSGTVSVVRAVTLARLYALVQRGSVLLEGPGGSGRRFLLVQLIEQLCEEGQLRHDRVLYLEWPSDLQAVEDALHSWEVSHNRTHTRKGEAAGSIASQDATAPELRMLILHPAPGAHGASGSGAGPSGLRASFPAGWFSKVKARCPSLRVVVVADAGEIRRCPPELIRVTLRPSSRDEARRVALELPLLASVLRQSAEADPIWTALHRTVDGHIGAIVQLEWWLRLTLIGERVPTPAGRRGLARLPSSWPWYEALVSSTQVSDASTLLHRLLLRRVASGRTESVSDGHSHVQWKEPQS